MAVSSTPPPNPSRPQLAGLTARRRRWPYFAGLVFLAILAYGFWPKPIAAEIGTAVLAPFEMTVNDEGQTRVKNRYVVSSPVAGQLRRIAYKAGAIVEAEKTPLAYLETGGADLLDARALAQANAHLTSVQASRQQAAALQARAQAEAEMAQVDLDRAKKLFERGGISQQELDQSVLRQTAALQNSRAATFAFQVAVGEEEQAKALLMRGQPNQPQTLEPIVITSPVTGRVLRVLQESERTVPTGFPLVEVGDPTDLEIWIEVLSRDGVAIVPGAIVYLDQWGGAQPLRARVRLVEPSAWTKISALGVEEQRVWVIADFVDPVEKRPTLGDAYRVEARVVLWSGDHVLQIPTGATFQRGGKWNVFVLSGQHAQLREVGVGHTNGLQTEITSGLEAGAQVIVYPGDSVTDGARIEPIK